MLIAVCSHDLLKQSSYRIKKALDNILRALDASVGKNMLSIYTQAYSRSQSDLLTLADMYNLVCACV